MTALALLARDVGVNERTLRRAVNEGALRATRPSPRKLDLPFSEQRYARRQWPLISKLRKALRTEHNVRFAMLIGSVARGDDTEQSDVDVIAGFRDSDFMRELDLGDRLEQAVGRSVDVIDLADAEADPMFLAMALEDARVLVDRVGMWQRLREREASLRRRGRKLDEERKQRALARADEFLAKSR
jgi:predicted nucleotidyltransferase